MAFLSKKTEEEREAERVAKEQARIDREAEKQRERERKAAAQAAEQARQAAFRGALPKWEYKVLTNSALAGWGGGTISGLEPMLNNYAEAGWRVVSMSFTGQIEQFLAADKNHLYIVLERPSIDDWHAGPPVERIRRPVSGTLPAA